jgi:pimeloyl-ACP methyl ester carboxylesterase
METRTFAIRRRRGNDRALVFIHGFGGDAHSTFGMMPAFAAGDAALVGWDIHCFGYPTGLAPDITGVWAADPDLRTLAGMLRTALCDTHFQGYQRVAIVAHSMGGLLAQRAALDAGVQARLSHLLMYGTPSNGLKKAGLARLFKRQARDMSRDGEFIGALRADWTTRFGGQPPFVFGAAAGVRDEFVPRESSVDPFPDPFRYYLDGNHLQIVKPATFDDDSFMLLRRVLQQEGSQPLALPPLRAPAPASVPGEAAGERALVTHALQLELAGRQDEAIRFLEARHEGSSELTGVLAGRLKRRWLADPEERAADGRRALSLYRTAHEIAARAGRHDSAFYNGINVVFMLKALGLDDGTAQVTAADVLEHCRKAPEDRWRLATEGEAHLYRGAFEAAAVHYTRALEYGRQGSGSPPFDERELGSVRQQAIWAARLVAGEAAEQRIIGLFATLAPRPNLLG